VTTHDIESSGEFVTKAKQVGLYKVEPVANLDGFFGGTSASEVKKLLRKVDADNEVSEPGQGQRLSALTAPGIEDPKLSGVR
jgi:hypothetical protein